MKKKIIGIKNQANKTQASTNFEVIAMLTRLYLSFFDNSTKTSEEDSNVLYSLLENIFRFEEISWEVVVQKVMAEEFNEKEILKYLNTHLSEIDKIRIILSIIVMDYADNDFSPAEISHVLNLAEALNLRSTGLMSVIQAIDNRSQNIAYLTNFEYKKHLKSIFSDYLLVGKDDINQIQLRNGKSREAIFLVIDTQVFISIYKGANVKIDDNKLREGRLYYCRKDSKIIINNTEFLHEDIIKLYDRQLLEDVIEFKQRNYNFKFTVIKNRFSLQVNDARVLINNHVAPLKKSIKLYYDDKIQISENNTISLLRLIRRREKIGVQKIKPQNFYLNYPNNFLTISLRQDSSTITKAVLDGDDYFIQPPKRGWNLYINNKKITDPTKFRINSDTITLNKINFRISNNLDIIEIPFEIDEVRLTDLKHFFPDGNIGLDRISFSVNKGDLMAIMGKSGCGKSTLLKTLTAEIIPTYGSIDIDGKELYKNLSYFSQYIGYVPQQDLLFSNLTVYENLFYRGMLRLPKMSKAQMDSKINNILTQLNLVHKKDKIIGDENSNILSGGERKRVNLALELLFEPTILVVDEPTSGLSSSDSEQIIEILREITYQGKIVIATIHQPSPSLFEIFDKLLLMDMYGKEVYFGDLHDAFSYFDTELAKINFKKKSLEKKRDSRLPEYFFDIINYPAYTDEGSIIYEHIGENIVQKRKFDAIYWKEKFKRISLYQMIRFKKNKKDEAKDTSKEARKKLKFTSYLKQFAILIKRNFKIKIRNRTNLLITFLETPLLALLISFILRLRLNDQPYNFYDNINMPVFLFISIIFFIFLGLSNSIEEIFNEKRIILREKLLNQKVSLMIPAKYIVLGFFSLLQVMMFYFISSPILDFHGSASTMIIYLFSSSMIGASLGILISSFINNRKALTNILPLILIPQIILGGAIIQFEKMNERIKLNKHKPIPEIVEFIPTRWLFEGLMTGVAKNNAFNRQLAKIDKRKLTINNAYYNGDISYSGYKDEILKVNKLKSDLIAKYGLNNLRNEVISLSVNVMDGKYYNTGKNVFLASFKKLGKFEFRTYNFNLAMVTFFIAVFGALTILKLKLFYK